MWKKFEDEQPALGAEVLWGCGNVYGVVAIIDYKGMADSVEIGGYCNNPACDYISETCDCKFNIRLNDYWMAIPALPKKDGDVD
jgi:hypothetical protein